MLLVGGCGCCHAIDATLCCTQQALHDALLSGLHLLNGLAEAQHDAAELVHVRLELGQGEGRGEAVLCCVLRGPGGPAVSAIELSVIKRLHSTFEGGVEWLLLTKHVVSKVIIITAS